MVAANSHNKSILPPYIAMFLCAAAVVVYQITLMRIASVTMWYHFAFMVISLALLGAGIASVLIYRFHSYWQRWVDILQIQGAMLFAVSLIVCPAIYLQLKLSIEVSFSGVLNLVLTSILFLIPFLFGGFVIASLITRHSDRVGPIYFADLSGAACGALGAVWLMKLLPAPEILPGIAILPILATLQLWWQMKQRSEQSASRPIRGYVWPLIGLVVWLSAVGITQTAINPYWVKYTKTIEEDALLLERWNPLARISVLSGGTVEGYPPPAFGWGMSPKWRPRPLDQYWIKQDGSASTPLTRFSGDLATMKHLAYDVTAIGYHVFKPKDVFIIGPGGGRDVLTALYFGANKIVGVELNPDIIYAVNEYFADFSGGIYNYPQVSIYADEARSFLTRNEREYDFLQISMIDSWAATVAGAHSLAENNLYTVEAFQLFLSRLTHNGVIAVSRWYFGTYEAETVRLASLCRAALLRAGCKKPEEHIAIINSENVATVLVKKVPFTIDECRSLYNYSRDYAFNLTWMPQHYRVDDSAVKFLLSRSVSDPVLADHFPFDYSPPTDDRPFFFHMLRGLKFNPVPENVGNWGFNSIGMFTLSVLLILVVLISILFILMPLIVGQGQGLSFRVFQATHIKPLWYFIGIGFGFLTIEIALIQRYVLYLGHPIYAVTIVIFSLLLGGGIGSYITKFLPDPTVKRRMHPCLFTAILILVAIQAVAIPYLFAATQGLVWIFRAVISSVLIATLGIAMGIAFPTGLSRLIKSVGLEGVPWLWAINSVCSVTASVLAIIIAIHYGYTVTLIFGMAAYAVSLLSSCYDWRPKHVLEEELIEETTG